MEYIKNNKGKLIYITCSISFIIIVIFSVINDGKNIENTINNEIINCTGGELISENEGKLVAVIGKLMTDEDILVTDETYNISIPGAVRIDRNCEQYRYFIDEEKEEGYKDGKKFIYDEETDSYYENDKVTNAKKVLKKKWMSIYGDEEEETLRFNGKNYVNPKPNLESCNFSKNVYLGDFEVDLNKIRNLIPYSTYDELADDEDSIMGQYHVYKSGIKTYITNANENNPEIGNYRVSFGYYNLDDSKVYTIVGKQVGNKIEEYEVSSDVKILKYFDSKLTKEEIIENCKNDIKEEQSSVILGLIIFSIILYIIYAKKFKK